MLHTHTHTQVLSAVIFIGDDTHSFAFDGCRCLKWSSKEVKYGRRWKVDDVIGCLYDADKVITAV